MKLKLISLLLHRRQKRHNIEYRADFKGCLRLEEIWLRKAIGDIICWHKQIKVAHESIFQARNPAPFTQRAGRFRFTPHFSESVVPIPSRNSGIRSRTSDCYSDHFPSVWLPHIPSTHSKYVFLWHIQYCLWYFPTLTKIDIDW